MRNSRYLHLRKYSKAPFVLSATISTPQSPGTQLPRVSWNTDLHPQCSTRIFIFFLSIYSANIAHQLSQCQWFSDQFYSPTFFFFLISVLSLHFLWLPRSKSSAQRMESHQRCYINTGKNKQAKKDPHEEVVNTQLVNVQKRFCTFGKYIKIISAERYAHTHFVRICLYIPTYSELRKWSIFCNSETILADDREVIENLVT